MMQTVSHHTFSSSVKRALHEVVSFYFDGEAHPIPFDSGDLITAPSANIFYIAEHIDWYIKQDGKPAIIFSPYLTTDTQELKCDPEGSHGYQARVPMTIGVRVVLIKDASSELTSEQHADTIWQVLHTIFSRCRADFSKRGLLTPHLSPMGTAFPSDKHVILEGDLTLTAVCNFQRSNSVVP